MSLPNRPEFAAVFQSFEDVGGPQHGAERIAALRAELARQDVAGFLIPRADRHQNEYVAPSDERLLWLTGFSGSAGLAIVLKTEAALFVDGRYTVQAAAQTDPAVIGCEHLIETPPAEWLGRHVGSSERIGFDPWLMTPDSAQRFEKACTAAGATLVALAANPIDAIWSDRPAPPSTPIEMQPLEFAGESAEAKLARIGEKLTDADGVLVSDAHNVAWAFNIRAHDVAHTPLPLCFAYAPKDGRPTLFLNSDRVPPEVGEALATVVDLAAPETLVAFVEDLGRQGKRVLADAAACPAALTRALEAAGGTAIVGADPVARLKAVKNPVEREGTRRAHIRDGEALVRFLAWFDREAPLGRVSEISAAEALETFRRDTGALEDVSFPSISAAGPHAAMPHYRVSVASNLTVGAGFYLIDSGGQYRDGTTDITRTIAVGRPSRLMRDRFTRVLKGHIAIARAVFPVGTTGAQIDALARRALWDAGLDFDHGVGHGVGVYLSVHEGPQRIAKTGTVALEPGMIVSNEPGYYAPGRFGVRIENLLVVEPRRISGAERDMLGFRTLSLAPIDARAVDVRLLDAGERAWLNGYHEEVRRALAPRLDRETRAWLARATRTI